MHFEGNLDKNMSGKSYVTGMLIRSCGDQTERPEKGMRLDCELILISALASFGKTTLLSEWGAGCKRPVV